MRCKILAGKGWRRCEQTGGKHRLFLNLQGENRAWASLSTSGRFETLATGGSFGCPSALIAARQEIIYADGRGLQALNWASRRTTRVLDLDLDKSDIESIWVPAWSTDLYFVLCKRKESVSHLLKRLRASGGKGVKTGPNWKGQTVFVLRRGSIKPKVVAEMDRPGRFEASNQAFTELYFRTGTSVWRLDIDSGKTTQVIPSNKNIHQFSITPTGEILAWDQFGNPGIVLYERDGQGARRISAFGCCAQQSRDGRKTAFVALDGVWLAQGNRPAREQILRLRPQWKILQTHEGQRARWCDCGRYFAVTVYRGTVEATPGLPGFDLVVVDTEERRFAVFETESWDYLWEPCQEGSPGKTANQN